MSFNLKELHKSSTLCSVCIRSGPVGSGGHRTGIEDGTVERSFVESSERLTVRVSGLVYMTIAVSRSYPLSSAMKL